MPLPVKSVYCYTELANDYLNSIPIKKPEDLPLVVEALYSLLNPKENHPVTAELKNKITDIKSLLNEPNVLFPNQEDYDEFKKIVLQQIANKVNIFIKLANEKEKAEAYIKKQNAPFDKGAQQDEILAKYKECKLALNAPTMSEEDFSAWRAYREASPNKKLWKQYYIVFGLMIQNSPDKDILDYINGTPLKGLMSVEQVRLLGPDKVAAIVSEKLHKNLAKLLAKGISFEMLNDLEVSKFELIIDYAPEILCYHESKAEVDFQKISFSDLKLLIPTSSNCELVKSSLNSHVRSRKRSHNGDMKD